MPLVVKFPFKGKSLRNKHTANEKRPSSSSKERVKRYREKLKTDPKLKKKFEQLKLKKKDENKSYSQQVKELRQNDSSYDAEIKAQARLRQQKHRKKKAALKAQVCSSQGKNH